MSLYTTPLQIGYFFSLLMWIIFLVRGFHEQRLSDKMLGWVMLILALELQDYTFGFAGINVLWEELKGFPRSVGLLFGPVIYLYFRAQVNRSFTLSLNTLWHFVPWLIFFAVNLLIYLQGAEAVDWFQNTTAYVVLHYVERIAILISVIYYLSRSVEIYRNYRKWSLNQFSNQEIVDFTWFRNFLFAMVFWLVFREVMNVLDAVLNLDFYQEWLWNLALVVVALYTGLAGYAQRQPAKMNFALEQDQTTPAGVESEKAKHAATKNRVSSELASRIEQLMREDRLYLQPELTLQQLSQHLDSSTVTVSAAINQGFGQNFNDYINKLRIEEFIRLYRQDDKRRFTLLSLALDSGFNSKATFNRAFKKIKGTSPKEFFANSVEEN